MRDLASNIASRQSIAPALRTTTVTGESVDRLGFESVAVSVHVGAYTDGVHTLSLEHSDDGADWSAVTSAQIIGTATVITDNGESPTIPTFEDENDVFGYVGNKRFVRAKATVTGSPAVGCFVGVDLILGHPLNAPVA